MKVYSARTVTSKTTGKVYRVGTIILDDGAIVDAFVPFTTEAGDEVHPVIYADRNHHPAVKFEKN